MTENEVKERLKSYKSDIGRLNVLKARIEKIQFNSGVKGIAYDGVKVGQTFKFSSITEDCAIDNMENYGELIKAYGKQSGKVNEIAAAISGLSSKHQKVIELKYLHDNTWGEIGAIIGNAFDTVVRFHKEALREMAKLLEEVRV